MNCLSHSVTFSSFASTLKDITNLKTRQEKVNRINKLFVELREKGRNLQRQYAGINTSLFPIIRLLVPDLDRKRGSYNFKKTQFSHIIVSVLPLSLDDKKLVNRLWKQNFKGSYSDMIASIVNKYVQNATGLSIFEVNEHLDKLASVNRDEQKVIIKKMLPHLQPNEVKWFVNILLKKIHLSIPNKAILNAFHPDAFDLYTFSNDLENVCKDLHDSNKRLNDKNLKLFVPFRPMLCQRCNAKELLNLNCTNFLVQNKYDGERFQIHMSDSKFKYFSRNGFDYTLHFGEDYSNGLFTPFLKCVINSSVESVIFDGEMMLWDTIDKKFGSKGLTFDVKKLKEGKRYIPVFVAYDIVFLNGRSLLTHTYNDRMNALNSIVTEKEEVFLVSPSAVISNRQEIIDKLNKSFDENEEGIVIKDPNSLYKPAERSGGWYKLKLEYFENTMNDLDVVIIGAYLESSRISSYLTAVLHRNTDNGNDEYLSFTKVASGLNEEEQKQLNEKLKLNWKNKNDNENLPDEIEGVTVRWGTKAPELYISPAKSIVLEIRGTELIRENREYASPYTLRFPRIQKIRFDKFPVEILTLTDLENLTEGKHQIHKLGKRHLKMEDLVLPSNKKRSRQAVYKPPVLTEISAKRTFLKGYEFKVLSGTAEWPKNLIEQEIKENGGCVVQYQRSSTHCIIYGDHHPLIDSYSGPHNIIKVNWLRDVIDKQEIIPYLPSHILYHGNPSKRYVDEYGDDYLIQMNSYSEMFAKMSSQTRYLKYEDLNVSNPLSSLDTLKYANVCAYFDRLQIPNDETSNIIYFNYWAEYNFTLQGGTVSKTLNDSVNLIIMHHLDDERARYLCDFVDRKFNIHPVIICENEIEDAIF